MKYDSSHLRFPGTIEKIDSNTFSVNGKRVTLYNEKDPANIGWGKSGVDIVCESTGVFLSQEAAQAHLKGGAKKVILSAPAKDNSPTYVVGVNHNKY